MGSTIYFHVSSVEPSETKWFLNKTESSITHERGTQFINRKATDFSDSGLYECKVDDKTIKAFYVIVYGKFSLISDIRIANVKRCNFFVFRCQRLPLNHFLIIFQNKLIQSTYVLLIVFSIFQDNKHQGPFGKKTFVQ